MLGDYVTKRHSPAHHRKMRPIYTHQPNSPRILHRASLDAVLRGCVDGTVPVLSSPTSDRPKANDKLKSNPLAKARN